MSDDIPLFFRCGEHECSQGRLGGIHAYTYYRDNKNYITIRRHDRIPGESSGGMMSFGENTLINRCAVTILISMLRLHINDAKDEEYKPYDDMLEAMRGTTLEEISYRIGSYFKFHSWLLSARDRVISNSDW